jgi:hypothetical protein
MGACEVTPPTLSVALATALTDQYAEIWSDGGPWLTTAKTAGLLADHALSDPAFRAALTTAIAEALYVESPVDYWMRTSTRTFFDHADDIVAAMLDGAK